MARRYRADWRCLLFSERWIFRARGEFKEFKELREVKEFSVGVCNIPNLPKFTNLPKHDPISCQKAADTTLGKKNADRLY